jgi:hypothetical protein
LKVHQPHGLLENKDHIIHMRLQTYETCSITSTTVIKRSFHSDSFREQGKTNLLKI